MRVTLPLLTNATEIATAAYPLRASALPKLLECPASVFMSQEFWIREDDDAGGGVAAQTGNLVHSGAAVFHKTLGSVANKTEAGLAALIAAQVKFPQGEPGRAKKHFHAYAADKENQEAEVVKVEQKIICTLDPAPWDTTRQPIVIRGTLDQLRMRDGRLTVDDIKTGARWYGQVALDQYITQQAAYTLGAMQTWAKDFPGVEFDAGALICTEGYFKPRGQVFWFHRWTLGDIPLILQSVVTQVAAARMGRLSFQPKTETCRWCQHKDFMTCSSFYKDHVR